MENKWKYVAIALAIVVVIGVLGAIWVYDTGTRIGRQEDLCSSTCESMKAYAFSFKGYTQFCECYDKDNVSIYAENMQGK